jgi:hypothetical protein
MGVSPVVGFADQYPQTPENSIANAPVSIGSIQPLSN